MVKRLTANGVKFREVKVPPMHKRGQVLVTVLYKKPWHQKQGDIVHALYFVPVHNQDIRHLDNEITARNFFAAFYLTERTGFFSNPITVEVEVIPGSVIKAPGRNLLGAIRQCATPCGGYEYLTQSEIIAKYNKPRRQIIEIVEWPFYLAEPGMTCQPPKNLLDCTVETHSDLQFDKKDK